ARNPLISLPPTAGIVLALCPSRLARVRVMRSGCSLTGRRPACRRPANGKDGAMRVARPLESLALMSLLLLGAACSKGGGGGSPVASDPTIPVIANLRVALGRPCTISGGANGTVKTVAVDYTDADGNLRGGVLELTGIADIGGTQTQTTGIPSAPV